MPDSQPLVCVFFQLPPSHQLFTRIYDIPWLILLPELENLTHSLEVLLATNPSPTAMNTLTEARNVMGSKMISLRDVMLTGRDFSREYREYVENVAETRMVSEYVKGGYNSLARKAAKKAEKAQQALSEFREELESVVVRVMSSISGDSNELSLFITKSRLIVSVMVTAIEECNSLLHEFKGMFLNITKQGFDPESFEDNPPSDEEFELVGEKWETLQTLLHDISLDWHRLAIRMQYPHLTRTRPRRGATSRGARDAFAPRGISDNPVNPEAPPNPPSPAKVKISFWRKFFQRLSCFSSKPF